MNSDPSSHPRPPRGIFVTGTDTDIGKTYVACRLLESLRKRGERVAAYKPVASGVTSGTTTDAIALWEAAGKPSTVSDVCPQSFRAPLAPDVAARQEGDRVDVRLLTAGLEAWKNRCDRIIVEGVGGYFSPIADDLLVADLAVEWGYPLLLVTANRLGTVHQTLATLHAIQTYRGGLPINAIVLNDVATDASDVSRLTNEQHLRKWCSIPIVRLGLGETTLDRLASGDD